MTRDEFGLMAEIDYLYWCLGNVQKQSDTSAPRDGLSRMIDAATGYDEVRFNEYAKEAIDILHGIRSRKRRLGIDVSDMTEFLRKWYQQQ